MIRLLAVLFFIVSLYGEINAQNTLSTDKVKPKPSRLMRDQIKQLKNGVLLVRLHSRSKAINALKEIGRNRESDELLDKQTAFNKKTIAAFKTYFTFCPTLFFYSSASDSLLMGLADKIVFLNSDLQPDPSIKINSSSYLVAEFGDVVQDTAKYFSEEYLYRGSNGLEQRSEYYGSPDTGLKGLRVLSDQLVQLKKPFPYYVRSYREFPNTKKVNKNIIKLNKNLLEYYEYVKVH